MTVALLRINIEETVNLAGRNRFGHGVISALVANNSLHESSSNHARIWTVVEEGTP
jgi:hypothetical protein